MTQCFKEKEGSAHIPLCSKVFKWNQWDCAAGWRHLLAQPAHLRLILTHVVEGRRACGLSPVLHIRVRACRCLQINKSVMNNVKTLKCGVLWMTQGAKSMLRKHGEQDSEPHYSRTCQVGMAAHNPRVKEVTAGRESPGQAGSTSQAGKLQVQPETRLQHMRWRVSEEDTCLSFRPSHWQTHICIGTHTCAPTRS